MNQKKLFSSLSIKLQSACVFLSLVGVAFGIKSYLSIMSAFGTEVGAVFLNDLFLQIAVALLANVIVAVFIYHIATKPIATLGETMRALAENKLDTEILHVTAANEIGSMARAVQIFKETAIHARKLEEERKQKDAAAEEDRRRITQQLSSSFEADVQSTITTLITAVSDLGHSAENMQKTVATVGQQSESAVSISQRAANNVANVSAAVEEMSASVKEIASQLTKSSGLVSETVTRTTLADKTTHALSDAVSQISGILQLIQDIAGQINLLALNATIESARAGDAGKGFAVVASEVKNLASQTTKATEEIARQIENVQVASREVVEVLRSIQEGIGSVNQYSSGITSAVEEQSAATREISANMQHAALGVQDINGNMSAITGSISEADKAAKDVWSASQTMTRQSELLKEQVTRFLSGIRG